MNRIKRTILTVLALGMSFGVWAQSEQLFYTLDGSQMAGSTGYATESTITQDGITWMVTGNTLMSPYWRIGGKNLDGVERPVYSTGTLNATVTKVNLEFGDNSGVTVNSITMTVASDAGFNNVIDTRSVSYSANSAVDVTPNANATWTNAYYRFVFNVSVNGSSNAYAQLKYIKFYYTGTAPAEPHDVEFVSSNSFSIEGGQATVSVDGQAATLSGGILSGVYPGQQVTLAAAQGYKFRTVEAEEEDPNIRKVTLAQFLAAEPSDEQWYKITGTVESINNYTYGNLYLTDGTTTVYVYGIATPAPEMATKQFATMGIGVGSNITIITKRGEYNGNPEATSAYLKRINN